MEYLFVSVFADIIDALRFVMVCNDEYCSRVERRSLKTITFICSNESTAK